MKPVMRVLQLHWIHVRINLRGGNVGVAEHFLNHPQIAPVVE